MSSEPESGEIAPEAGETPPVEAESPPVTPAVAGEFGRLHPSSVMFSVLSQARALIVPAVIVFFGASSGGWSSGFFVFALVIGLISFFVTTVVSVVHYLRLRYRIQNGELVVTEGVLFRRVRTVPVQRIQNVNLVQNLLHRAVGVAEVRIETAGGTEPEATLRVLPLAHVDALREAIFGESEDAPGNEAAERVPERLAPRELLRIPTPMLVRAGLANNRGMILAGVAVGAAFEFDLADRFDFDRFSGWFDANGSGGLLPLVVVAGVVLALLIVRLLSVVWFILRFHDYRLTRRDNDLQIRCGLFTRISATVPRRRIQLISVQQNIWMRVMGLSSIKIETAGGSGEEEDNATSSVSSRWFVPVMPSDRVAELLAELREGFAWREDELDWKPVAPDTRRRLMRLTTVLATLAGLIGLAVVRPWGLLAGVAAWLPLYVLAVRQSRAMRYARMENGVVYRSGLFTRKISMTFFDRVQTLRVDQTPFDRRWNMARLSVDTAAAGPAQHTIHVPFLTEDFARAEYEFLRARVSGA